MNGYQLHGSCAIFTDYLHQGGIAKAYRIVHNLRIRRVIPCLCQNQSLCKTVHRIWHQNFDAVDSPDGFCFRCTTSSASGITTTSLSWTDVNGRVGGTSRTAARTCTGAARIIGRAGSACGTSGGAARARLSGFRGACT